MNNPNNGQQVDPNAKATGHQAASITNSTVFERYHKHLLKISSKADIKINIHPDGSIEMLATEGVNGVCVVYVDTRNKYSLDQKILLAFKTLLTKVQ